MFSTDKNVETIAQLVEVLKHYIGLQKEYMKLDVIEKIVRLITVITLSLVLTVLVLLILIYLSFAAAYALEPAVGTAGGFCIVAGVYFIAFILIVIFRKKWIEKPLVRVLASILMDK
jgi:polyferredoxin